MRLKKIENHKSALEAVAKEWGLRIAKDSFYFTDKESWCDAYKDSQIKVLIKIIRGTHGGGFHIELHSAKSFSELKIDGGEF